MVRFILVIIVIIITIIGVVIIMVIDSSLSSSLILDSSRCVVLSVNDLHFVTVNTFLTYSMPSVEEFGTG